MEQYSFMANWNSCHLEVKYTPWSINRDASFWMEAGERVEPDVFAAAAAGWEWALDYSERLLWDTPERLGAVCLLAGDGNYARE